MMSQPTSHPLCRELNHRQCGVTLVELMIAMVLGLLLTAGIVQVFLGNRSTYAFSEGLSWIQENARFGINQMTNQVRMAGAAGCLPDYQVNNNFTAANALRDDLRDGVQGYGFTGTGPGDTYTASAVNPAPSTNPNAWAPALPPELGTAGLVIPGSDVVVVRYVSSDSRPLVAPFSDATQVVVAAGHGFQAGQILAVTDCQKTSLFQLTGTQTVGTGDSGLLHATGGSFAPGNAAASWGALQSYGLGATVASYEAVAFYVGEGRNGSPSLYQLRLQRTSGTTSEFQPEELLEGVDTMQVRYGIDTDNDRQVDTWETAGDVNTSSEWPAVLSVEIALVLRSDEEYGTRQDAVVYHLGGMKFDPVDDRRLRQVFTTTVGVRNRLP